MRTVEEVVRVVLILATLVFGFLLGRPLYWGIQARLQETMEDMSVDGLEDGSIDDSNATSSTSSTAHDSTAPQLRTFPSTSAPQFAKGVRAIVHEGRPLADVLKRPIWERPRKGTPVPGKEEFALRREMVEFRASPDKLIVVTFANFAFMDFVVTWVKHLTDAGVTNILTGAMDHKLLEALFWEGVPVFDMESGIQVEDAGWGSPVFHKMGREKVTLVNVFLHMGFHLLICDTDAVFLRDPLPFMARYPSADVLMSSDNLARTVHNDSLERWDQAHGAYNIGILLFRPTDAARRFARSWSELLAGDDNVWDQNGFNDEMRKKWGPEIEGSGGLFWSFDGTLRAGILPVSLFCSGHTFFIQRLYKVVGMEPYAVHTTFQFSGSDGKRHRLREAMVFEDPPGYFDPPGGVLSFVSRIPPKLLVEGNHTLESHFRLMNYQLRQLRFALALATILNRTLVFPEIWARFDSQYFPHAGIVENTDTAQPLLVPLDHLLQVEQLLPDRLPEEQFGPAVRFREYSFFDNPRTPPELKASKITVQLCQDLSDVAPTSADADTQGHAENSRPAKAVGVALPQQEGAAAAATATTAAPPAVSAAGATSLLQQLQQEVQTPLLPCTTRLASPSHVLLRKGSSDVEIAKALAPYQSKYKWIEFESVEGAVGSWVDPAEEQRFNLRLRHTTAIWCCVYAHPGHIYYDFFADTKPGWRPRPPSTPAEDHPPWD